MAFVKALVAGAGAFLLLAASAAAAEQPLIGADGKGRIRVLDADLNIVPGTPALPRSVRATALSPNGRRVATWAFSSKRLTIRSRKTFRAITTRRIDIGSDVYWPTKNHLIAVSYYGNGKRPNVIRAFNLARGTSRTIRLRGLPEGVERVGRVVRIVTQSGPDFCCPTGRFRVTDIGAAGVVKRRWRVPLPDDFVISDESDQTIGMRLSRNLLLATQNTHQALIRVHRGTTKPLDLPSGYYDFVGRNFVFDRSSGEAARIDRDALTATPAVATGVKDDFATPFHGGFIVGFGRVRYDRNLQRVAENPTPPETEGFERVVAHDRLYDLLLPDCDSGAAAGAVIADARTGAVLATRPGAWRFGVLGGGYLKTTAADEICD
jgi:hypothetical protein